MKESTLSKVITVQLTYHEVRALVDAVDAADRYHQEHPESGREASGAVTDQSITTDAADWAVRRMVKIRNKQMEEARL